jgi:hypothetical protein
VDAGTSFIVHEEPVPSRGFGINLSGFNRPGLDRFDRDGFSGVIEHLSSPGQIERQMYRFSADNFLELLGQVHPNCCFFF